MEILNPFVINGGDRAQIGHAWELCWSTCIVDIQASLQVLRLNTARKNALLERTISTRVLPISTGILPKNYLYILIDHALYNAPLIVSERKRAG